MIVDLDAKGTQAKFAQLVGITQPAVSGLIARGVLVANDNIGNWLLSYCGNLRETAAGRLGTSDLDLTEERARLAAAQADKLELELAVTRAELAPVATIESVLVRAGGKVGAILDAVPQTLKRRLPHLTSSDLEQIQTEIAKARNAVAGLSLEDIEEDDSEEVD